ncbi:PilN domain-containing protein [Priestia taiwanensis]|uniref:PilN domain-containing protein n=1 Tax=Priestia taiwanensis TaxID=1347902 RepID=UPI0016657331|nr:PilN domain-containing protein [Priestia taiwanensis]MBM7363599.1 Tfp pilus assembly protein PilN [Priestia taiwanensis]
MYSKVVEEKQQLELVKTEIQQAKAQKIGEEKKLTENTDGNSLQQLQTIVTEVEKRTIKSVNMMDRIVALLPAEGYFKSYTYAEGKVTLQVVFKEYTEAAFYYKRLQDEEWIQSVKMPSVNEVEGSGNQVESHYVGIYEVEIEKETLQQLQKGGES